MSGDNSEPLASDGESVGDDVGDRASRWWPICSAALLAKAIGELCFEDALTPEPASDTDSGEYVLSLGAVRYSFRAGRTTFGGWRVEPDSVWRTATGILGDDVAEPTNDVARFVVEACQWMGTDPATVAGFVAETTATLAADVRMAASAVPIEKLVELPHQELEGHFTGHPWLIANKGRIGFSAADLERYAPEARRRVRLPWLAVHRGLAEFRGTPELSEVGVREHELPAADIDRFARGMRARGFDPDAYVWMPVHPWQLDAVVRTLWAPELATGRIVELGEASEHYLPTQAIRTMSNVDSAGRFQVKLPLRILNTSVYRGIPPHCTATAPALTQWLRGIFARDEWFGNWRTVLLGELASVTVRHPVLSTVEGAPYQWQETLGCIWREPISDSLDEGERAWSLAAVLHQDADGGDLVGAFIARSGRSAEEWTRRLLAVLLRPLLHLLYRYGIAVNPHGENILVICSDDHFPARLAIKDLVDDVNVSVPAAPERGHEPDTLDVALPRKPWSVLRQYLVDALLIGVLRPLAELLADRHGLPTERFWALAAGEIDGYRRRFASDPEIAARMTAGDLLGPTFGRYPLNGFRLTTGYGDMSERPPVPSAGTVANPMHALAPIAPIDG